MTFKRSLVVAATVSLVQVTQAWNVELPPCLSPFKPFVYSGCFQDGAPGQPAALIYRSPQSTDKMTVENCVAECKGNGFRYAGLSYYGQCFCGDTVNGAQLGEDKCNFPCNGNKSETCGGNQILSVWQDPTFPTGDVDIGDYKEAGCYSDNSKNGRTLSWSAQVDEPTFTIETCLTACEKQGFPLAGVEFGHECWCGNVLANDTAKIDDSQCNKPCQGNSKETCGGSGALNLYIAKDLESLEPCGYTSSSVPATTVTTTTYAPPPPPTTTTTPVPPTTTDYPPPPPTTTDYPPPPPTTTDYPPPPPTTTDYPPPPPTTTDYPPPPPTTTDYPPPPPTTTKYPPPPPTTTDKYPPPPATTTKVTTTDKYPPPPGTTTKPNTTYKPPHTTTSTAPQCTKTITVPPTCDYKCGDWCLPGLPDWEDQTGCLKAFASASASIASCFKSAGFPSALKCFEYSAWVLNIQKYCNTNCWGGKCNKSGCWGQYPPTGGNPPKTTTTVVPCPPSTTTKAPPTTSTKPTTCPPPPTNICTQPSNPKYGYGPGNPVGGIPLPLVSCNDNYNDWRSNPFKLYNNQDRSRCPSYPPSGCGSACSDACKEQYEQCVAVYQQGCQDGSNGRYKRAESEKRNIAFGNQFTANWGYGNNSPSNAALKCKAQYQDCLAVNKNVKPNGKCTTWGW
ncbi:WSC domain-containing protein [Cladobotryum mycophilum]|uniref:WSC domain-containing protein n=1 Tax=Cladobotryum mycophilum TaxID=491253 RepID=A0ABR0SD13_9HYPO